MASVLMCGVEDLLLGGSRFVWTVTVAALRRWYAGRLRACRQTLRAWCGLGDVYQVWGKWCGTCCGVLAAAQGCGGGRRLRGVSCLRAGGCNATVAGVVGWVLSAGGCEES